MIIQTIGKRPSRPDQADAAPNVSRENPTSAIRLDCMQQSRKRKVVVPDHDLPGPASLRRSAAHLPSGPDSDAARPRAAVINGVRSARQVDRGRHDLCRCAAIPTFSLEKLPRLLTSADDDYRGRFASPPGPPQGEAARPRATAACGGPGPAAEGRVLLPQGRTLHLKAPVCAPA